MANERERAGRAEPLRGGEAFPRERRAVSGMQMLERRREVDIAESFDTRPERGAANPRRASLTPETAACLRCPEGGTSELSFVAIHRDAANCEGAAIGRANHAVAGGAVRRMQNIEFSASRFSVLRYPARLDDAPMPGLRRAAPEPRPGRHSLTSAPTLPEPHGELDDAVSPRNGAAATPGECARRKYGSRLPARRRARDGRRGSRPAGMLAGFRADGAGRLRQSFRANRCDRSVLASLAELWCLAPAFATGTRLTLGIGARREQRSRRGSRSVSGAAMQPLDAPRQRGRLYAGRFLAGAPMPPWLNRPLRSAWRLRPGSRRALAPAAGGTGPRCWPAWNDRRGPALEAWG